MMPPARPWRIGVDATLLRPGRSGIGHYTEQLIRALASSGRLGEILLMSNREPQFEGPPPAGVRFVRGAGLPWRAPWMQGLLPLTLRRERPDLVHYTNFLAPVFYRHPYVVTFHDLSLYKYPHFFTWRKRYLTRSALPAIARRARAVLTVSEAMRREILETLDLPEEKVCAVHLAPMEIHHHAVPGPRPDPPYILWVGNLEPRKNVSRLLEAFDLLKDASGVPHQLWLVGGRGWKNAPIVDTWRRMRHREEVRFLDYVPASNLGAFYAAADLFVFPSLYEGFGLPPLEAMCCRTPVVASDIAVHREVDGEAAIYADPLDPKAIALAMRRVLEDPALAEELRRRGREQVARYSWEKTARETLAVYDRVLGA